MTKPTVFVVGGGAAGFFAAITAAEAGASVTLLERAATVLAKVKISGGGRCNVTHACFDPKQLVQHYPRGGRELLGPFHRFQPRDTMAWFQDRGVMLKTEPDGRVFPVTDQSQTIIDALVKSAKTAGVTVRVGVSDLVIEKGPNGFHVKQTQGYDQLEIPRARADHPRPLGPRGAQGAKPGEGQLCVKKQGEALRADRLLIATGSGTQGHAWARAMGHTIVDPVPSLFTFSVPDPRLKGLAGVSVPHADLNLEKGGLRSSGPMIITHQGLSGPAVLKLSAWAARVLHERGYKANLRINWVGLSEPDALKRIKEMKALFPRQELRVRPAFEVPRRLWERLAAAAVSDPHRRWADASAAEQGRLAVQLTRGDYAVVGKGTFKEEFVTAGGVALNEVNFSTMESRLCPGLFFAGEVLDVDGLTGGFNFQNAWTTGWLAGRAMAQ
jgi:predicted flavoprotein YhiN